MNNIREQVNELLKKQTELRVNYQESNLFIEGKYFYSLKYQDVIFDGIKDIKIDMDYDYPSSIPKVYIFNLNEKIEHVYKDNSICLATVGEILNYLVEDPTISEFLNRFLNPFIFSVDWHFKYGIFPFGERKHGYKGLISYYTEEWGLTKKQYYDMVRLVYFNKYRGHLPCVCNSGLKLRDCHGKHMLPIVKDAKMKSSFLMESAMILFKDGEKYGKNPTR